MNSDRISDESRDWDRQALTPRLGEREAPLLAVDDPCRSGLVRIIGHRDAQGSGRREAVRRPGSSTRLEADRVRECEDQGVREQHRVGSCVKVFDDLFDVVSLLGTLVAD